VNRQDFVFLVIPLGDKLDQQAIEKNAIFKGLALKRAGNVMIGGVEPRKRRLGWKK